MDNDALNMRNWGYYEPLFKGHLGLQLMSPISDRDTKNFLPGRNPGTVMVTSTGAFHPRDCMVSEAPVPMDYVRESWINQRDRFLGMLPVNVNPSYNVLSESSASHALPILESPCPLGDEREGRIEEIVVKKESKKRQTSGSGIPKTPKPSKARKPKDDSDPSVVQRPKPAKRSLDVVINGIDMDISGIPIPVCSCTGTPQQCYRWGCGGWQSACCTTNVSTYPLPMSTKRRGARIAGRKMSQGAFKKVLERLVADGYNFGNPIDLRTQWARHGTNKFVTIR